MNTEIMKEQESKINLHLENYAKEINFLLKEFFHKEKSFHLKKFPYDFGMLEKIEEFCLRGGKKLRPFLFMLGFSLLNKKGLENKEIIQLSIVFELVHAYLLIHDDFMDESEIRRSLPTIHKLYEEELTSLLINQSQIKHMGSSLAILAGDLAQCLWIEIIIQSNFSDQIKKEAISLINRSIRATILGQELDLRFEARKISSVKDILEMYRLKTAEYTFETPLNLGLLFAQAKEKDYEHISQYALSMGLIFQIKDDILGIFGEEDKTGKSVLDDLRRGKQTILVAKAVELASSEDKDFLIKNLGRKELDLEEANEIKEIIKRSGALLFAEKKIREEVEKSKEILKIMRKERYDLDTLRILESLIYFIADRNK